MADPNTTISGSPAQAPDGSADVADLLGLESFEGGVWLKAADALLARAARCSPLLGPAGELGPVLRTHLAAHFYSVSNPEVTSKSVNGASKSYARPTPGEGLKSTSFGRTALLLDTTGRLDRTAAARVAGLTYLGTPGNRLRGETRRAGTGGYGRV